MKIDCKIIEDLLPLYLDNVCSEQTKMIVEEHLKQCANCQKLINHTQSVQIPQAALAPSDAEAAVKKGFRKIRMRWWASILVMVIVLPLVLLGWNQYHNRGVHYSNIYELQIGKAFMKCIDEGDYEKAYTYIDIAGLKQEWLERWFDEKTLENIEADGLAKFFEYGKNLEAHGGINGYKYIGISYCGKEDDGTDIYQLAFKVKYAGEEAPFSIMVSNDGIEYFTGNGSFVTDPLAQFAIWSEYLWQSYEGCYYDPNLQEYIYPDA